MKDPINNLIKEFFKSINIEKSDYLKMKEKKILFILDGFDEINKMENIYNNNEFKYFPNSKILITCREEYFNSINIESNYFYIFSPNKKYELVSLFYLSEFNKKDREIFIENFIKLKNINNSDEFRGWDKSRFLKEISNLDKNSDYSNNPFNLNLLCSTLPELEKTKKNTITRFDIYDSFMKKWFEKEFDRINNMDSKNQNEKILKNYSKSLPEGVKEIFEFSENLAVTLFKTSCLVEECKRLGCIEFTINENNHFKEFFKDCLRTTIL